MSSKKESAWLNLHLRRDGAPLPRLDEAVGRFFSRVGDGISPPSMRRARRQVRRYLEANGLTIVLVSAMMIFAWMVTGR
ncbi:MAG: hypothetical protein ACREPW_11860 [Candidatus Binataceae bacterium]